MINVQVRRPFKSGDKWKYGILGGNVISGLVLLVHCCSYTGRSKQTEMTSAQSSFPGSWWSEVTMTLFQAGFIPTSGKYTVLSQAACLLRPSWHFQKFYRNFVHHRKSYRKTRPLSALTWISTYPANFKGSMPASHCCHF